ncbi:MYCBP-associated protein [Syngnathoides biaculeatus]|uniref:MYCBP-associated protein n=1 Tax=Syngnathoides biaculeatus TaxID=300417 RepID=UPI002ADDFA9A|nr:MYCBP-associated protein [Syngnathoides biaculeatus]XP_061686747.1 MYCBP-associated protein [Syngnathoides biaculeatus]XP_061686749.1 MYCBP-associated protein [Syngnathoides biaculeatus]XP_061686750.1 MYCBP-associated protein [Syngnathoides biaculeatus]XP_061686751.1 MYCBP-associated protein [Syngnathoides biaculeatus]XP_061686752.1 MYCBP-associated protein [Syngnathoides biaculeatus]
MAHELRSQSADVSKNAHPATRRLGSQSLVHMGLALGSEGFQFDDRGMLLPHSILGTLDSFRNYLEARGETELVRQIPNFRRDCPSQVLGKHPHEGVHNRRDVPFGQRNIQANALQHWDEYIKQRRRQQNILSERLQRPVENLLMNRDYSFKELQQQRELLRRVLPLIQSGYGHRVGSEFWSLPQHYGNELSGIRATLTQTEQGKRKPVTIVGQPHSILQESGITCAEMLHPASQILDPNMGMQQCALQEVQQGLEINKKDLNQLVVIGSSRPVGKEGHSILLDDGESVSKQRSEIRNENPDPMPNNNGGKSNSLLIPGLRFAGQLARWTGNSTCHQGMVGIITTIIFEALVGERVSSQLEISNVGSTALLFSWQQLPLPQNFSNLQSQSSSPHFYFNTSSGVIYPGETQQVEFIFKSAKPGIRTEQWQLNTHPLLLKGASIQVTLKGVSQLQDKTARQRQFIETKLEETARLEICRNIVYELLRGIQTPERSSSPAEPYTLQYFDQSEEDLNKLLQEMNPEHIWDLSDTSRQDPLDDEMGSQRTSMDKFIDDEQDANCDDTQDNTDE